MNNKFLAAALLLTAVLTTPAFASTGIYSNYNSNREIKLGTPVKKIIITGNVDIVLTTDGTSEILIDGKPGITRGIKLVYDIDQLEVIATSYRSNKRYTVKIPAQQLKAIEINGDGQVYSESYISAPNMEIFINGACHVNIRSTGSIYVKAAPEFEINYKKNGNIRIAPNFY